MNDEMGNAEINWQAAEKRLRRMSSGDLVALLIEQLELRVEEGATELGPRLARVLEEESDDGEE